MPQPSRIVVVDDEPLIAEMVCDILEEAGFQPIACTHAYEACAVIRRERPVLVLLDVQMVGIGGIEVFLQLRADPLTAAIPVMFLTANPSIVKVHLPDYAARNAALLPKPFNITVLNALVQRLIAHASV